MKELHDYTRPGVTYEANVVQFEQAGMNVHGVSLGDEVQCIDYGFNPDAALRIQGRVIQIEVDELSPNTTTQLTIGQLRDSLTNRLMSMGQTLDQLTQNNRRVAEQMANMTTARYINELLGRINEEINATGGYSYFVPGEGVITYDTAVTDPLIGSEATKVVQIKGGSIRIADSKKPAFGGIDDWNWRSVFTSGSITADLVTTAHLVAGYIGDPNSDNYWDLDNQRIVMSSGYIGDNAKTYWDLATGELAIVNIAKNTWNNYDKMKFGQITFIDTSGWLNVITTQQTANGLSVGDGAHGEIVLVPNLPSNSTTWSNTSNVSGILSKSTLKLLSGCTASSGEKSGISLAPKNIDIHTIQGQTVNPGIVLTSQGTVHIGAIRSDYTTNNGSSVSSVTPALSVSTSPSNMINCKSSLEVWGWNYSSRISPTLGAGNGQVTLGSDGNDSSSKANLVVHGNATIYGNISVSGTKPRLVNTKNYGNRYLYAYETASPMFGDIGSGITDENGVCYVEINDMFSETARTDYSYQVFLQKCGDGDLWVADKTTSYFIVNGTPNVPFDWELKARQIGYDTLNMESDLLDPASMDNETISTEESALEIASYYDDYIEQLESIYSREVNG